ncbi:hypothetical protein QUB80_14310 [Chlorogloeopsis sp. ULAP01]|uniref:hypothetical protein n=1 Tax=Chlorogloeopsis sp. ULAP01 TaxID=3056483 RepID=UPI0025AB1B5E|nr:hypothetical protein [Chlorogloeopsis sp. ULAP01]MDM9381874.1 hypothetical protein [Chlorogloeopsis sp. ULAP01]
MKEILTSVYDRDYCDELGFLVRNGWDNFSLAIALLKSQEPPPPTPPTRRSNRRVRKL